MESRYIYPVDRNELFRMIAYKCESIKEYQILTRCLLDHIEDIYKINLSKIYDINTSEKTINEVENILANFFGDIVFFLTNDIEEAWECKNAYPENKKNLHKRVIYLANLFKEYEENEF